MGLGVVSFEAAAAGYTSVTLPGTAGAADADMQITFYANSDVGMEISTDGGAQYTEYSATSSQQYYQGAPILVPKNALLRVRNTHAGTVHTCVVVYRYLGSEQ